MWSTGAMIAVLVVATQATPENPQLAQARALYRALEYERCVRKLEAALKADVESVDLPDLQLYQGLCKHGLGRTDEAENHFRLALRLDPKIAPPDWVSPTVLALFDGVKSSLPKGRADDAPKKVTLTPEPPHSEELTAPIKPPPPARSVSPVPLVLTGGAALAAGTGVFFGVRARGLEAEFRREEFEAPAAALSRQSKQAALAANISYAVSAALAIAAGVAWKISTDP